MAITVVTMKHCKQWGYNGTNHLPTGAGFRNHPQHVQAGAPVR